MRVQNNIVYIGVGFEMSRDRISTYFVDYRAQIALYQLRGLAILARWAIRFNIWTASGSGEEQSMSESIGISVHTGMLNEK